MVRPERFELPAPCFVGQLGWANSVILQHGWQQKSTFRHPADIEVVPNWYSLFDHLRKVATPVHPDRRAPSPNPKSTNAV